jgi:hypothetical protein
MVTGGQGAPRTHRSFLPPCWDHRACGGIYGKGGWVGECGLVLRAWKVVGDVPLFCSCPSLGFQRLLTPREYASGVAVEGAGSGRVRCWYHWLGGKGYHLPHFLHL